jgi:hypothetical protein
MRNYYFESILAEATVTAKSISQEEALKEARNPQMGTAPKPVDAKGDDQRDHIANTFRQFFKP